MPASPCRTYTDPQEKAAWDALNAAETRLEGLLKEFGGAVEIGGMAYYLDEHGQMLCAPMGNDGVIEKEQGMHRNDYEGLSAAELSELAGRLSQWFDLVEEAPELTASNYEQTLQRNGFEIASTGGGCYAWFRRLPAGCHLLITNENDGHSFVSDDQLATLVAYSGDDINQVVGEPWQGPLSSLATAIVFKGREALSLAKQTVDKEAILDDAINAAVKVIQDALGVRSGDTAGVFFSGGEPHEKIRAVLSQYFDMELDLVKPDFEVVSQPEPSNRQRPGA